MNFTSLAEPLQDLVFDYADSIKSGQMDYHNDLMFEYRQILALDLTDLITRSRLPFLLSLHLAVILEKK